MHRTSTLTHAISSRYNSHLLTAASRPVSTHNWPPESSHRPSVDADPSGTTGGAGVRFAICTVAGSGSNITPFPQTPARSHPPLRNQSLTGLYFAPKQRSFTIWGPTTLLLVRPDFPTWRPKSQESRCRPRLLLPGAMRKV